MKRTVLLFALSALLAGCQHKAAITELSDWQFSWHNQWYPATVPGFIHTNLMDNDLIPDPFYGTNEDAVQWVSDRQWRYRTTVACSDLPTGKRLFLVFEGLAGNATIHISGCNYKETYSCDNMFIANAFPIPDDVLCDSITILVEFNPSDDSARQAAYGIALPDRRAFTRIAPYQQGWDWGPRLTTCGIWKPVYITNRKPVFYRKVNRQLVDRDNLAAVYLADRIDSIGKAFAFRDRRTGSKTFDEVVFMKGANWIPAHSFPVMNNALRDRYRMLLCAAKEANFNMIRVWGGGIYEHDYFFDLCDSLGLMVWMDFNFSTMLYPDDGQTLSSIQEEARQNVFRIMKHPCVVLWCGNNEVKNGWEDWGWQDVFHWSPEQRARLRHGIDTLFKDDRDDGPGILACAVRDYDWMGRRYIETSPLYGWGHPECTQFGDSHYWGIWWGEEPFEMYKEKTGRFMSEYGFQSYPLLSSIRQFCPEHELDIDSPTLRSHQKHARGRQIIDKAMLHYYGFDSRTLTLENYAYVSQLLQAWGTGYGIFCHLSDPRCDGTLYWQLNDCWPVASWSSIDYYGNWKALHYRVRALYADTVDLAYWADYYSTLPKARRYPDARYELKTEQTADGSIRVTIKALTDLYDVLLEPQPHANGHFSRNFFDLKAGQCVTAVFIPTGKEEADKLRKSSPTIRVKTLNDIMRKNK